MVSSSNYPCSRSGNNSPIQSRFLDIEAEVDSENESIDEEEDQTVTQGDQDFIDDAPDGALYQSIYFPRYPTPPNVTWEEELWASWGGREEYEKWRHAFDNGDLTLGVPSRRSEAEDDISMDDGEVSAHQEGREAGNKAQKQPPPDFSRESPDETDHLARILRTADAEEPFINPFPPRAAIP
ncbi:hypothetical protein V5O48_017168, partial [Marasmius crinis-equi]